MTALNIDRPEAILISGLYIAIMFAGYMLCWERRAGRQAQGYADPEPEGSTIHHRLE